MKSICIKRSIMIAGRWSSLSLEVAFWKGLEGIATDCGLTLPALVDSINSARDHSNLSSAIRLFVLDYYRAKIGEKSRARRADLPIAQRRKQAPSPDMRLISINSEYCHERAAQARKLANRTRDPEIREAMLAVAEQYENLASRAALLGARAHHPERLRLVEGALGEQPGPPDRR